MGDEIREALLWYKAQHRKANLLTPTNKIPPDPASLQRFALVVMRRTEILSVKSI